MAILPENLDLAQVQSYWAGYRAGLARGNPCPDDADAPPEWSCDAPGPGVTEADRRWAAETGPLDGGWPDDEYYDGLAAEARWQDLCV